ncbi:terminase large subunit domain-containing protein [Pseudonocardia hydrocarbonoxydans]|uniref:terminase large subunit domain-containing protein n=1 Tax=Pseudonocardia hydrocarbonoxydans TaxID=76726 RepID=UPI001C3F81C4|nr:terminase family protein [Pseudonocardia hydrocarbonoxydans]
MLDVEGFAANVLHRRLWPHQLDVATSPARYRVVCAGRQVGKSVLLAVLALHTAATRRNATVLLVSAGEEAAKRLLAECAGLARDRLSGSVLDETRSTLALSNGSTIRSVPASERQIRGWPVDLLIVDEAGFVADGIWRAAEPAIIARPGSRVVLCSSPWGGPEAFFPALWQRGMDRPDEHVAGWHWPSSVSPRVDAALLEQIREREPADYFRREFLAEWGDAAGVYFSEAELMGAVADYELTDPARLSGRGRFPAAGGLDWGVAVDANALVVASVLDPAVAADLRWRVWLPWMEVHYRTSWSWWIERVVDVAEQFRMRVIASERNGVGAYPTEDLAEQLRRRRTGTHVAAVWTDVRRKQAGFAKIKTLLQSDRLVLPRHPELLKQLRALEFEQLAAGGVRIAVPERAGHDDLALAAMQAVSCVETRRLRDAEEAGAFGPRPDPDTVRTGAGVVVPRRPVPIDSTGWLTYPAGEEAGDGW